MPLGDLNLSTCSHKIVDLCDIEGTHPDAAVAGRIAEQRLLRGSMNIDTATEGIAIMRFQTIQPENACHDRITTRGIRRQHLTGGTARVKHGTQRGSGTDLLTHAEVPQRGGITPFPITDTEFRGRYGVEPHWLAICQNEHLLIGHAHYQPVMRVGTTRMQECHRTYNDNEGPVHFYESVSATSPAK